MSYADLAARLDAEPDPRRVTALPDGSVDTFYAVYGDGREPIDSAADFGERIAESVAHSFPVAATARRPGGQAVNVARQSHALGDDPTLFGHLDDPIFDDLPFETHSMGESGEIRVLDFADEEVLLANDADDLAAWSLADFEAVADDPAVALAAPAVCCGNWVSAEGLTDAFRTLGDRDLDGGVFVLDPGKLPAADRERVRELFAALSALESTYDVVVSVNRAELVYAATSVSAETDGATDDADADAAETDPADADPAEMATTLRAEAGVTAVVMHDEAEALAATAAGTCRVPNLDVSDPTRHTGAGDRFGAALAHALVREWNWAGALALGNLAAAHYVGTDETGDRAALREFLRNHDPKA